MKKEDAQHPHCPQKNALRKMPSEKCPQKEETGEKTTRHEKDGNFHSRLLMQVSTTPRDPSSITCTRKGGRPGGRKDHKRFSAQSPVPGQRARCSVGWHNDKLTVAAPGLWYKHSVMQEQPPSLAWLLPNLINSCAVTSSSSELSADDRPGILGIITSGTEQQWNPWWRTGLTPSLLQLVNFPDLNNQHLPSLQHAYFQYCVFHDLDLLRYVLRCAIGRRL